VNRLPIDFGNPPVDAVPDNSVRHNFVTVIKDYAHPIAQSDPQGRNIRKGTVRVKADSTKLVRVVEIGE
jgi:hypothetical protein